jgi:DNA repair exonuclease SbcCD ATPase subunit
MLSKISVTILAILVVTLGVTTIAFSKRLQDASAQLEQAQAGLQQLKDQHDAGRPGSEDRLRELLNQQEEANNQLREELARLKQDGATNSSPRTAVAGDNAPRPASGGRGGGAAWMDRLRQENPERYKQMIQQREERRKAMDQRYQETIDQLDQRAQSAPTQAEADLVGQIADTLAKLNDLRQKWQAIRNLPEDQQQALTPDLAAQMRQTTDQLRDLSQQDRTLQLQNFARSLGVTDDNGIESFVNGVTGIYSNTNIRAIIGGGFGGGGPGGPGGGGGRGDGTQGQAPPVPRP